MYAATRDACRGKLTGTGAVRDMKVSLLIPTNLSRTVEISLSDGGQTGGGARPTHHGMDESSEGQS